MDFQIRHAMPGRIRLHVPLLAYPSMVAEATLSWLKARTWVKSARVNYDCACLVVEYEAAEKGQLDGVLALLRQASVEDLEAFLGQPDTSAVVRKPAPTSEKFPLGLPTLSLGLALIPHPLAFAVNVPLTLYNAIPIFKRAWRVWSQERRLNVDFLDTLAITASVGQGNLVAGTIVVWLIRLGDWIRDLTAAGSKRAIRELLEFQSRNAWVVRDGTVVSVPATALVVDDLVVVYPGDMIPVDGAIERGHAMIDQKTITGEGLAVSREVGEQVFAATIVQEGQITIRAARVGDNTTAGQIARLVESNPVGDTRMQNHAERFADRLVMPTLGLAIGTALLTRDFNRFLSLVIVDYGTGIRVAAPTSVLSSMTHAARSGIVIKSGGHMEKLARIDTVVFDKTGTLSFGTPHVTDVVSYAEHIDENHLLALAGAAETHLQHPVAEALREKIRELSLDMPPCDETEYHIGLGVEGQVNGYYMHVGSERFLRRNDIKVDHIAGDRAQIDERGHSCLYVAVDGKLAGLVAYEDRIRPESHEVIARLHAMGVRDTVMLTGDNAVVASAVGRRLGLTRQVANMMPADKAEVIQSLQREGRSIAMIGDGINDSPALSFADVGIAMKHGADIAHEAADVILMEDSLWKLVQAIEISRDAVGLIKQNYGIVAVLNTIALGLALPGNLVGPEMTALISNGSAIIASLNGVRPLMRRP
ncbi:heavy metal translocating P-type ATPase [Segnochrobactrum spirostomi]|uniref:P-type Zn(2+) transporter n=1 Tax=Segnochrobactrum spirostomi TaxID=2608987 RepID=A0A6A7YAS2_9HYPH|nr:heavy metal translocating P-type ATPase [Segnochrobactrum spirostomi]MQT15427.1 heavy metal translocating P-type ATPase [Segnochrobactrum spirostomi]